MSRRKMLGRLGWFGQCSCCNSQKDKKAMKQVERREWKREWAW